MILLLKLYSVYRESPEVPHRFSGYAGRVYAVQLRVCGLTSERFNPVVPSLAYALPRVA